MLRVSSPFVTGKFLAGGTLHNTLEALRIESQELDPQGMRQLGKCTHLKKLCFCDDHPVGIRQGISDWSFLSNLTELEALTLLGDFPDEALAALAKMPSLRFLAVRSGRLTDKGVAEIAKCQSIEELETGLILTEKISVSIQSMKNLKSVFFLGSEIVPTDLEKARPGLKIVFSAFAPGPGSP